MDLEDFEAAAKRMSGVVHHIKLVHSGTFSKMTENEVYLKCENQQKTGSFKVRGAFNKISKLKESNWTGNDVVACSAGNHAQGVAFSANHMNIKSTIIMPGTAPIAKINATRGYGAEVVLHGECYDDTYEKSLEIVKEKSAVLIPAFEDDDIILGQGTIALEILQDLPTVDVIIVPCGGGGLLAGIANCAKKIKPNVKVIGVQSEGANAVYRGFLQKKYAHTEKVDTIADGIAIKNPGKRIFEIISEFVDEMVIVNDSQIASAILLLIERSKLVVEPAGVVAVAALLNKKIDCVGKRCVCVLSGGNIDVEFIQRILERGLVEKGRRIQVHCPISDKPGGLRKFCSIIEENNGNIISIQHDRVRTCLDLLQAEVYVTLEVGGHEHGQSIVDTLEKQGYKVEFE